MLHVAVATTAPRHYATRSRNLFLSVGISVSCYGSRIKSGMTKEGQVRDDKGGSSAG